MPIIPFKHPENREYRSIIDSVVNRLNILNELVDRWALKIEHPEVHEELEFGDLESWQTFYQTYREKVLISDNKDVQIIAKLIDIAEKHKTSILQNCKFAPNNYDDDLPDYLEDS